jgi:hypothetical protein
MKSASESTRPYCIGRYTVDLPAAASEISMGQSYKGITITAKGPWDQMRFHREVSVGTIAAGQVPSNLPVGAVIGVTDDGTGLQTVRGAVLKEDTAFLLQVQVVTESTAGAKVAVADLLRRIRLRGLHEVPSEKGFCIDRGFIPGTLEWDETASFGAMLPQSKAEFVFNTDTGDAGTSDGTLATMSKLPPFLSGFMDNATRTLRKDTRQVVGRKGDEYGYLVKNSSNVALTWSVLPGDDRAKQPGIEVRLDTTAGTNEADRGALLTEWDAILASIKVR